MIDKYLNANLELLQKFRTNNSGILKTGNSKNPKQTNNSDYSIENFNGFGMNNP